MIIRDNVWNRYISVLRELNNKAAQDMIRYMSKNDLVTISEYTGARGYILSSAERKELIDYAYALATKYGEGAAAAAAEFYDALAIAAGVAVPPAVPAATATYAETAKAVNGTIKKSTALVPGAVSKLVKMAGADTTLQNAKRDRAYCAWVPRGDTCAFCIMLASKGWQPASASMVGEHAAHIHDNCDCAYVVRFGKDLSVEGYDPARYKSMYDDAGGATAEQKLNSMRRQFYAENSEKINAQKRDAYAKRKEREASAAEETDIT